MPEKDQGLLWDAEAERMQACAKMECLAGAKAGEGRDQDGPGGKKEWEYRGKRIMSKLSAGQDVCLAEPFTTICPVLFLNPDSFSCARELTIVSQHINVSGGKPGWL